MTKEEIILYLKEKSTEKYKTNIIKLGIPEKSTIGVSTSELRKLARKIPKDKEFLIDLWNTDYHECKILTVLAINSKDCGEKEINMFMDGIESWDLCDLFCKTILIKKENFKERIDKWIKSDELYIKRAAFTLIASTSVHVKNTVEEIEKYLELIDNYSDDERLLVKKAASWALRELGKINEDAKIIAIEIAEKMAKEKSKSKKWIAKDALKELTTLVKVEGRSRLISSKTKMGKEIIKI